MRRKIKVQIHSSTSLETEEICSIHFKTFPINIVKNLQLKRENFVILKKKSLSTSHCLISKGKEFWTINFASVVIKSV